MSRVVVIFSKRSLSTSHDALDLVASAARYRELLEGALRAALPDHAIEVREDERARTIRVEVDTDDLALARSLERDVLDHAWVVRQMGAWAILG